MGVNEAVSTGSWPGVRPPNSAYCCQRSASINSAAARSLRIAMSPRVWRNIWAEAVLFAISPAPTVAVPANSPFFINDRRLVGRCNSAAPKSFKYVLLIKYLLADSYRYRRLTHNSWFNATFLQKVETFTIPLHCA